MPTGGSSAKDKSFTYDDPTGNAIGTYLDYLSYPALKNLDVCLSRNAKLGRVTVTPSVELFNVFNSDAVLGVFRQAATASFRRVDDLLSPRILRPRKRG